MATMSAHENSRLIQGWLEEALAWGEEAKQLTYPSPCPNEVEYHRSAFQKSVRRGLPELAIYHGEGLRFNDEKAAWFALSVIAGEDVGIGAPHMVALTLLCTLKTFRAKISNESKLFKGLIYRLCLSNKNRLACQINVFADLFHPESYDDMGDNDLLKLLATGTPTLMFTALRQLRKRARNGNVVLLGTVIDVLKGSFTSPGFSLAAALLFERATDDLHYGLAVVMSLVYAKESSGDVLSWPTAKPSTPIIHGTNMPYCALDQHTMIGRSALTRATKIEQVAEPFLECGITHANLYKAIGALTFFKEASVVFPCIEISAPDFYVDGLVLDQEVGYLNKRAEANITKSQYAKLVDHVPVLEDDLNGIRKFLWLKQGD